MNSIVELASCASTQDEAYSRLGDPELQFVAVRALEQSRGQGRQSRSWHSPLGNLYLSVGFRVQAASTSQAPLPWPFVSLLAGLATAETLRDLGAWDESCFLKWPNDIYRRAPGGAFQKIGGILTELRKSRLIVGIGINVTEAPALSDATYSSVSLSDFSEQPPSAASIAERLVPRLRELVESWTIDPSGVSSRTVSELETHWMREFFALEGEADTLGPVKATGLAADGRLHVLDLQGKTHLVSSGEFRLKSILT